MSKKNHISISAFVSEDQRAAIQLATTHFAQALSQAAGVPWTCDCVFRPDMEALRQDGESAIIITSLLTEMGKIEEPWPQVEQRLRAAYAVLGESGNPVFICTVLRHVSRDEEPEPATARRIFIRRLNLLAAEISRETGAYVIDLDRVMADIGARRLKTDYRLTGNAAVEMAGHFIALTLINNALDSLVSFEVQDAAREILTSNRPTIAEPDNAKPEVTFRKHLLSMVHGRKKLLVSPVIGTVQENHSDWLIRQVLRGKIGPTDALHRLSQSVRRWGFRQSAARLVSGLSRQIIRKK